MKIIRRFFSKTINVVISVLILVITLFFLKYLISSVQKNVQIMDAESGETLIQKVNYPVVDLSGKTPEQMSQIKRGEYLAKAGDCAACHTNALKGGLPFAGGLPMLTPFGTIYSPNITSDKQTGIGNWTDEQFIRAMREGISPSGNRYYPAFPYLYFNKVTTEDLLAIKAYLNSLPAVQQATPKNTMVWPFNWRFLQLGWQLLFFYPEKTGPFVPDQTKSDPWNRGAYLVEGLGHCAMCHTPSYSILSEKYPLGAPIRKYDLTGAKIQGYLAPNITHANIGTVSDAEILKVFTHDQMIGGGKIEGPMLEVNQNSLSYLTQADLLAIVTYLKSVKSQMPPRPKAKPGKEGQGIYQVYCDGCHATGAGGAPRFGDAAAWNDLLKKGKENIYNNAIRGIDGMPAKGTCFTCSNQEIKDAVNYMFAAVAGKQIVEPLKKLTLADGKKVYDTTCSHCHNTGLKNAPKIGDKKAFEKSVKQGFVNTYLEVLMGKQGHPARGACTNCSDAEIKAAVKYLMTESSDQDYSLW